MKTKTIPSLRVLCVAAACSQPCVATPSATALGRVEDQYHSTLDVYTDAFSGGNNFVVKAMMGTAPAMDEASAESPHSGTTCIKATYQTGAQPLWGGWYFMNGVALASSANPIANWGTYPNAGVVLTGATQLSFWARGAQGGERVKFFCLGVGRDADTGRAVELYPESAPQIATSFMTLSTTWTRYTINLTGPLNYVLGGFGWVTSDVDTGGRNITFYLDDIQYNKPRLDAPRFLNSYAAIAPRAAFDTTMVNTALTEDNAVALLAFLSLGDNDRAKRIADALMQALNNDRLFTDGRLRNGYQSGELLQPDGWEINGRKGTVRIPGWIGSDGNWHEDDFVTGSGLRSMAWSMVALLAYGETTGSSTYLPAVVKMGDWIEARLRDTRGAGGYMSGFVGADVSPVLQMTKSTEDNAIAYAAFMRLYRLTNDAKWLTRATYARNFAMGMWDGTGRLFWLGTESNGTTMNKTALSLSAQTISLLALRDLDASYYAALTLVEQNHRVGTTGGFDFDPDKDGVWYAGTAQMAVAFMLTSQSAKATAAIAAMQPGVAASGAVYAASKDGLTTGLESSPGVKWLYYRREHVGATGWMVLAEQGSNPFWIGTQFGRVGTPTTPVQPPVTPPVTPVEPPVSPLRIINLSTRAQAGTGSTLLIGGFVIGPGADKSVLIRAVGPTLGQPPFNIPGTLADPLLTLFRGEAAIAVNDNWGTDSRITQQTFSSVGAFALQPGSRDAAILATLAPGSYTAQVSGAAGSNAAGTALIEVYEMDRTGARLLNLSTRGQVLTGTNLMLPGIVVGPGSGKLRVLIRVAGPALGVAPFNVQGVLSDPLLIVTDAEGREVARNDNWQTPSEAGVSSGAELAAAATSVGAFPFPGGSRDAAIILSLGPGNYTVQATGVGGVTGIAIVEVYELP